MGEIFAVVGQAGTGKTTWLMQKASDLAPRFVTTEHHRLLAITRMHGSRRRLEMKLLDNCPTIPCSVNTIDGFALSLLNRWRRSLGYNKPIQPTVDEIPFTDTVFSTMAGFSKIITASTVLLGSETVRNIIHESYPLIMIDEFQDCYGPLLDFVKALAMCSALIVAADDFQLLDATTNGCPAVEWLESLHNSRKVEITELTTCQRTSVHKILYSASCLRKRMRVSGQAIPVFCCPREAPMAWKIIDPLVLHFYSAPWSGTTALICPSHDPFIDKVLNSCTNQLQKRGRTPIHWYKESTTEKEREQIRYDLGLGNTNGTPHSHWSAPMTTLDPIGNHVVRRIQRFARLRGVQPISPEMVSRHIDAVVSEKRAYRTHHHSKVVTTVHGAKNREFDNVFVLWTYKLTPDQEQQRRLLYNAVTRAKQNCMVLVLGDVRRVFEDPVLSLLGTPLPAFSSKQKNPKRKWVNR